MFRRCQFRCLFYSLGRPQYGAQTAGRNLMGERASTEKIRGETGWGSTCLAKLGGFCGWLLNVSKCNMGLGNGPFSWIQKRKLKSRSSSTSVRLLTVVLFPFARVPYKRSKPTEPNLLTDSKHKIPRFFEKVYSTSLASHLIPCVSEE